MPYAKKCKPFVGRSGQEVQEVALVDDERQLIERTLNGDLSAFRQIVHGNKKRIYFLAYDFTGNHQDAEDVLQDVLLKAYRGLSGFRGQASLKTWLQRITINTCLSRKTSKLRTEPLDPYGEMEEIQDSHPRSNPERQTQATSIGEQIEQAIERLSPMERIAFILRHYHQKPIKGIASELHRSEGTVKSLLFRAGRKLQKQLAHLRSGLEGAP